MPVNYVTSPKIVISSNTESLLLSRAEDDYRVHFAHYILFGDGIREDISNSGNGNKIRLRKAKPGDSFTYSLIQDYDMIKLNLEQNLSNLATLKAKRQLDDLKRIWVFSYDITEEEANKVDGKPTVMIYSDPNASDVNSIIKDDRIILGLFIVVEYDNQETAKNQDSDSAKAEWVLISPPDNEKIDEYNKYLRDMEAEALGKLFYIKFDDTKNEAMSKDIKTA
jgi:hypothetical protein